MEFTPPGRHKTLDDFRAHLARVAPDIEADEHVEGSHGPLGRRLEAFGRTLANRFAIHPMEGWDGTPDGLPTELTLRRWRNFGRSGAALVWGGEAFAVRPDGRANPNQLCLHPDADTRGGLEQLLAALHDGCRDHGGDASAVCVGLQLTHSGRFARPTTAGPAPRIAGRHPVLDARVGVTDDSALLTDAELESIGAAYVRAAELAQAVGFDFVDVKACHGYLMHELLGARSRSGPYGGDFDGRTRFFREVVAAVRAACPGLGVATRVSLGDVAVYGTGADGHGEPKGWAPGERWNHGFGVNAADARELDLEEPLRFLELLKTLGVREVNVTLGSPYTCPHLQRPATYPPSDGYAPPRDPLHEVARHLRTVRACKRAQPELVFIGTGYSYLQEWLPHVAQREVRDGHVDLVGLGRVVLSYPDLPRDVLDARALDRKRICRTFSDCTTAPRHGLPSGCYPLDPHYKELPEASAVAAAKAMVRDRDRRSTR